MYPAPTSGSTFRAQEEGGLDGDDSPVSILSGGPAGPLFSRTIVSSLSTAAASYRTAGSITFRHSPAVNRVSGRDPISSSFILLSSASFSSFPSFNPKDFEKRYHFLEISRMSVSNSSFFFVRSFFSLKKNCICEKFLFPVGFLDES